MTQRIGVFDVEVVRAEQPKFAAPLLLLHGLWTGPWIWQRLAGFCAHRGWTSFAPRLRTAGSEPSLSALSQAVSEFTAALDAAPVVIGHDLGGLLALSLPDTPAAVAICPLRPGPAIRAHPLFGSARARWARLLRRSYVPGAGHAAAYLGVADAGALAPEPSAWVDVLALAPVAQFEARRMPSLVVAGGGDRVSAPAALEQFSQTIGADYLLFGDGDHGLPYGAAWQSAASSVHRWIVRQLGESLLLLRGDEDLRDE